MFQYSGWRGWCAVPTSQMSSAPTQLSCTLMTRAAQNTKLRRLTLTESIISYTWEFHWQCESAHWEKSSWSYRLPCVLKQKVVLKEAATKCVIYLSLKIKEKWKLSRAKGCVGLMRENTGIFLIAFPQSKAELSQRILCFVESFEPKSKTIT